jgi:hypothetical protein
MAAVRADRAPEPVRSFGTFTTDLHRLVDWFTECGVETVVMESTSVYWIPIFELLDARGFTVFLVNARDAKHVPGRKTCWSLNAATTSPPGRVQSILPPGRGWRRATRSPAAKCFHHERAGPAGGLRHFCGLLP